ncbi:MAG: IS1 family transposase [Cyanobacteriota bacterium]|nr:IS1 family transposase [Cyanobacteriota bacterium]
MTCPDCQSSEVVKYGKIHSGKQRYRCHSCHRQFVLKPNRIKVSSQVKAFIDKLLLERLSLAAIARVIGVSLTWLQKYVNRKALFTSEIMDIPPTKPTNLTLQCDEMWSFVGSKANQKWVWLAIDADTGYVLAGYIGDRTRNSALCLWNRIPVSHRKHAQVYTDFWDAYQGVIPKNQHHPVGKETGKTNRIERFNNTLRQRIGRLVRKALSFSKKTENHISAIFGFLHHHNESLLV